MPMNYTLDIKTARMQAVIAALAGGVATNAKFIGRDASTNILFTVDTAVAPFATAVDGVLTFTGVPLSGTASGTGTLDSVEIQNGDGTVKVTGLSVGLSGSGAHVILDSLSITTGQTINIVSATITHG